MTQNFCGGSVQCPNHAPHLPHVTGTYVTVRFGELDNFCKGVPGPTAPFVIIQDFRGSASIPSRYSISTIPPHLYDPACNCEDCSVPF